MKQEKFSHLKKKNERYRKNHPERIKQNKERYYSNGGREVDAAYRKTDAYRQSQKRYKTSDTALNAQLKFKYGITISDYYNMIENQKSLCAACLLPLDLITEKRVKSYSPVVDHCHKTKKVRGVIHGRCNKAIGHMMDSPELLRLAASYLEKSNEGQP